MAQLATCPHCASDFLLPTFDRGITQGTCPQCERVFSVAELSSRDVREARPVETKEPVDDRLVSRQTLPSFSGTTLASFLKEAEQRTRRGGDYGSQEEELPPQSRPTWSELSPIESSNPQEPERQDESESDFAAELPTGTLEWGRQDDPDDQPSDSGSGSSRQTVRLGDDGDNEEDSGDDEWDPPMSQLTIPDMREISLFERAEEREPYAPASDPQHAFTVPDLDGMEVGAIPLEWGTSERGHNTNEAEGEAMPSVENRGSVGKVAVRRRRTQTSAIGLLLKMALAGVVGSVMGYLIVLWCCQWMGRTDDPLGLAHYYPNAVLPQTFKHGVDKQAPKGNRLEYTPPPREEESTGPSEEEPAILTATHEERFALVDDAAVEPLPVRPTLKRVPEFNLDDLQVATTEATAYAPGLLEGDFAQSETRKVKGAAYAKLAHLAQVLAGLDPNVAGHALVAPAQQVFPPLFQESRQRAENSLIAEKWITSANRKHGGIFFCGQPDEGVERGSVVEYHVQLPSRNSLPVFTTEKLDFDSYSNAQSVGVVGYLLEDASRQIEGYNGQTTQGVWAAFLFPIGS
jgi:hypothetical protein